MAALRRGIAHYQGGTEEVPAPTPPPERGFRDWLGDVIGMRGREQQVQAQVPAPAPASTRSPLSTAADMFTGDFGNVVKDPRASAFSSYIAGINQAAQTDKRVRDLGTGAPALGKLWYGLFGDQADWNELQKRDQTAQVFREDPLLKQHLMNDPNALAAAEKDPHGYAHSTQNDPVFRDTMKLAVKHTEAANANPRVTPDEVLPAVKTAVNHDINTDAAHAALAPHKYTRDEFAQIFAGVSPKVIQQLFGQQLGHVPNIQERYISALQQDLQKQQAGIDTMAEGKEKTAKQTKLKTDIENFWKEWGTAAKTFQALPYTGRTD